MQTACNRIQELLDKLDGKDGTIPKGFAELRKVFKGADGAGDIKALLGTLQALPESIQKQTNAAAEVEAKSL